jgi:DNA-binding CsgD family transcriptional regulator
VELAEVPVLEELESAGLIDVRVDRRRHQVSLSHPVYAQTLQTAMSRIRCRTTLLDQVARTETRGARRREDPLRVAVWRLDATGTAEPRLLLRAARLARGMHDHDRLERLARGVLLARDDAEARLLLAESLIGRRHFAEADEVLAGAEALPAPDALRLEITLTRALNTAHGLNHPDRALRLLSPTPEQDRNLGQDGRQDQDRGQSHQDEPGQGRTRSHERSPRHGQDQDCGQGHVRNREQGHERSSWREQDQDRNRGRGRERGQGPDRGRPGDVAALAAFILSDSDRPAAALRELPPLPDEAPRTPLRRVAEAHALAFSGDALRAVRILGSGDAAAARSPHDAAAPAAEASVAHEAGRSDGAVALSGDALGAARASETGDAAARGVRPLHEGVIPATEAMAAYEAGRFGDAVVLMARALDSEGEQEPPQSIGGYAWRLARMLLGCGRPRTAARWARDAIAIGRYPADPALLTFGSACLATALAQVGDVAGAKAALAELTAGLDALSVVPVARAWTAAADGDLAEARDVLLAAADEAQQRGQGAICAGLLHDVARFGDPHRVAARLGELTLRYDSPLIAARAAYARGAAARDGALLEEAAETFTAMGSALWAAEAAAAASAAWRAHGETRRATAAAARSAALAQDCEGARSPALAGVPSVDPLTPREREICLLAARGVTSRQIAERLVLSVRTVNNHLQNAYTKLGVGSRSELATVLETAS